MKGKTNFTINQAGTFHVILILVKFILAKKKKCFSDIMLSLNQHLLIKPI